MQNRSDGYVPGSFVLELKGRSTDWLGGLFQGLAYRNKGLDFSQIVVAAKDFLVLWQVNDRSKRADILNRATWHGMEFTGSLFLANPEIVLGRISSFEEALRKGGKVRQRITIKNFVPVLKEMKSFIDADNPVKTVRAFYAMVYAWTESSTVQLSYKAHDQATLGGEVITNLVPSRRNKFKDFVENRFIDSTIGSTDDFFARYDEALDAVDRDFRIKHGIFFTDRNLSRFVMWLVKEHIPDLGRNYLVIDPACGSGNLVTNWRSPLELRHKVVSEIEPELLFAVEQRMKGDQWHNGRFTVVPKISENKGLNFLDRNAEEYLNEIRKYLIEKGHSPDKPLAFLCNPPYRSDDDQSAAAINYEVHESIRGLTGEDASSERYCCFLAQMKLICEAAKSSGLPGDSLLLLFTTSSWLTKRAIYRNIRAEMLGAFQDVAGVLINGKQFFNVPGTWPVVFSIWRYRGKDAKLNPHRSIPLVDLTWLTKEQLGKVAWDNPDDVDLACRQVLDHHESSKVEIGMDRISIREWTGKTMLDFKRSRRKSELNQKIVGGLPFGDTRQGNKKAYGETNGSFIGFMDDLTLCRVKNSVPDHPWFRLNNQFMDINKNRCFSGPPTQLGLLRGRFGLGQEIVFLVRTCENIPPASVSPLGKRG